MATDVTIDPFQVFEVEEQECHVLHVTVLCGRRLSKGSWLKDLFDTPDPYIELDVPITPCRPKKTTCKDNSVNPVWNENFTFLMNPKDENILEITLKDANYTLDETVSHHKYNVSEMPLEEEKKFTLTFLKRSEVDFIFYKFADDKPVLRFSLSICEDEKEYMMKRQQMVFKNMQDILGDRAPKEISDVPNIGVIGSGGGFRAMTAYCGVFEALVESKILDMVSHVGGLSGSTWYLSFLYSHPDWPAKSPGELSEELKKKITSSWVRFLFKPTSMYRYINSIIEKQTRGQPVSFTDFFGHLIGETLLEERKQCLLSEQQEKIKDGNLPLPLYTCLSVKKTVSARIFHEHVEFSPYEISVPKYGTSMKTQFFGSKFFLGRMLMQHPEPPLHFLQGVWGSAFTILFSRLVHKKLRKAKLMANKEDEDQVDGTDDVDSEDDEKEAIKDGEDLVDPLDNIEDRLELGCSLAEEEDSDESQESDTESSDLDEDSEDEEEKNPKPIKHKRLHKIRKAVSPKSHDTTDGHAGILTPKKKKAQIRHEQIKKKLKVKKESKLSQWQSILTSLSGKEFMNSRAGRAGRVHNFLRGLSLQNVYPFSPFTPNSQFKGDTDLFRAIHDPISTKIKRMTLVDGGLCFNSPYPLLLRPQRGINLILSFDFTQRHSDFSAPFFKELKDAELWAYKNHVPFPPIDDTIHEKEGVKECYVFKDPNDLNCPVVMHFVLMNKTFKDFKAPGVPRETEEEKEMGDFSLFDDPEKPFSTFNFTYTDESFDRLTALTKFNTLLNSDLIKDTIVECIGRKKAASPEKDMLSSLKTVGSLKFTNRKKLRQLERHLSKDLEYIDE